MKKLLFIPVTLGLCATTASARQSPSDQLKQEAIEEGAAPVVRGEDRKRLRRWLLDQVTRRVAASEK